MLSKSIKPEINSAKSNSNYTFTKQASQQADSSTPNIEESVRQVQDNIGADNLALGAGRVLRKFVIEPAKILFSAITSSVQTSTAYRKDIKPSKNQKLKELKEIDKLIEGLKSSNRIKCLLDDNTQQYFQKFDIESVKMSKTIQSDVMKTVETFIKQLKSAAKEGPKTRALIKECLANINNILILDAKWSKDQIAIRYSNISGGYNSDAKNLIFISPDGKVPFQIKHIVRSFTYVAPLQGSDVDIKAITECQKRMEDKYIETVNCLSKPESPECKKVVSISSSFKDRLMEEPCSEIKKIINPDYETPEGPTVKLTIGQQFNKKGESLNLTYVALNMNNEGRFCYLKPKSFQLYGISQEQENMMNFVANMKSVEKEDYAKALYEGNYKIEMHASMNSFPEKAIKKMCPEGYRNSFQKQKVQDRDL